VGGFITEMHFEQAEIEFPGIRAVYLACEEKPRTFLDLVARYLDSAAVLAFRRLASTGSLSTPAIDQAR